MMNLLLMTTFRKLMWFQNAKSDQVWQIAGYCSVEVCLCLQIISYNCKQFFRLKSCEMFHIWRLVKGKKNVYAGEVTDV